MTIVWSPHAQNNDLRKVLLNKHFVIFIILQRKIYKITDWDVAKLKRSVDFRIRMKTIQIAVHFFEKDSLQKR